MKRGLLVLVAASAAMAFWVPNAFATFHGVAQAKTCVSPTKIGDPYTCQGSIQNTVDQGGDTIEVTGVSDTVNASGGSVATGNILSSTGLVFGQTGGQGTVTCTGHTSGDGSVANPWLGATDCFLTFGATITTVQFSHYTVQPGDFNIPSVTTLKTAANAGDTTISINNAATAVPGNTIVIDPTGANPETRVVTSTFNSAPGVIPVVHTITFATPLGFAHLAGVNVNQFAHRLTDSLNWNWNNTCTFDPTGDCTTNPQIATAGASTLVQKLNSSTATAIHNAAHQPVTVVAAGSVVHDSGTVSGQPGSPNPSGNVNIDFFSGGTAANPCSGTSVNSGPVPLDASGNFDATGFPQGPLGPGFYGFIAHYTGDARYIGSDGPCEPLRVVDANIQISPNGVNRVGQSHTFTAHVNVNDGTGPTNAPDGTQISFTIDNGPGSFTTPNPCTTAGGTGSCQITLSSNVTGVTTVSAHVDVTVAGVVLHRDTNGTGANSGPATKTWVNARIHITPSATNRVGAPHTFTVTLEKDTGTGTFVPAAGEHVDVTLTDSNGAAHTAPTGSCTNAGANTDASGQCTITFTSNSTGTVTGHATSTLSVAGSAPFTVQTDGVAPNGPDAVKTFVDAKISIAPNATNRVGQPHTFTVTLLKDSGNGAGFQPAAGETVTVTLTGQNGASPIPPGPFTGTTDGSGHFQVTFTSNTTGTVTGHASSTLSVAGSAPFTVQTDGTSGNSGDATKTFVNARIHITPSATNRVGAPHTFTVTLEKDTGTGTFVPAAGEHVDVTLTDALGASHTAPTGSCTNAGANTDASGQCTITFTSNSTGTVTGHATSTLSVAGSAPFTVQTDGVAPNGPDAVKTFVDAKISIAPNATNEVGHPHTFTVTLLKDTGNGAGFVPAAGEHVDVTLSDSNGASHTAPTGSCTNAGANTDASGQCTITFTSNSAGKVTGHATSNLTVGGVAIHVETDGTNGNSGDAVKTFVDANIQITPNGTNRVGQSHTFTAHVNVNDGSGAGYVPAPDGTQISFTIDNGPGAFTTPNPCTTAGGTGSCQITLVSNVTGMTTVSAHVTLQAAGVSLTRSTNGVGANSGPATKTWVNAAISIAPNATNEVGHSHTFTVTLVKDTGNGAGFVPAAGEHVDVTLSDSNGASHTAPTGSCTNAGANTDANGQCTITFTSNSAGKVTGHATSTLSVGGVSITVATDGVAPNSADAVKTFVDANIQISPQTATNPVGSNHTLTGHVNINDGSGAGFVPAPAGTTIQFSLTNSGGATASFVGPSSCTTVSSTGSCTVVISSPTAGTTTIHATTNVTVGGVSLVRATGDSLPGDSPDATKHWASAKISIAPDATNEINHSHTFTVTLQKDTGGGFVPAAGEHVDVTLTDSNGAAHTAPTGTCTNAGPNTDANGQCTITFTSPSAGLVTGHASATIDFGGGAVVTVQTDGTGGNSGNARKWFVDANIQITPATANNPVNNNHTLTGHVNVNNGTGAGYVSAPDGTTITFQIVSGPGSFVGGISQCTTTGGTGSCTVQITSSTPGTTVVSASVTLSAGPTGAGFPPQATLTRTTDGQNGNSANASKNWADDTVSTKVLDASNTDITGTTVNAGTVVHDTASVAKAAGTPASVPAPTGSVTFKLFDNGTCNGNLLATDANEPLSGGTATSVTFTTPATAGSFSYLAHYNGDANYPGHDAGCEPFNTKALPTGLITPTNTSCNDVLNGTASVLGQINYPVSGGTIGQGINPGVFFFYSKITTTTPNQVVTVTQSNTSTNNSALFGVLNGQAWLWSGDCSSKIVGTVFGPNGSQARFTVPTPGNYIIGIKYQTKSIAGTVAPVPSDITFNFATSLGGTTGASVLLKKQ